MACPLVFFYVGERFDLLISALVSQMVLGGVSRKERKDNAVMLGGSLAEKVPKILRAYLGAYFRAVVKQELSNSTEKKTGFHSITSRG